MCKSLLEKLQQLQLYSSMHTQIGLQARNSPKNRCNLSVPSNLNHVYTTHGCVSWFLNFLLCQFVIQVHTYISIQYIYSACALICINMELYSSQDQRTALDFAMKGGHHDTIRVLFERGALLTNRANVSGV